MRDFLHIMDDYGLVNENLSAKRILEILSNDDPSAYDSIDCNLELEVSTFYPTTNFVSKVDMDLRWVIYLIVFN